MTNGPEPLRWTLADGRELLFFALPGHEPAPVTDRRPLPAADAHPTELRYDRATGRWVIIAADRQDRTYQPPPDACPLCPGPTGQTSEIPAPDYDVVVFENRFPSLRGFSGPAAPVRASAPGHRPSDPPDPFPARPGDGRCEVVCFTADHRGSFAGLPHPHARLVVDVWRHRTAELLATDGIEQVFCFENRGAEIGVTLAHPHGQIYGYPYLTPRTTAMLEQARRHRGTHGTNLFGALLAGEIADGRRILVRGEHVTAFVPFAARWPVEVHIYPNRPARNLTELDEAELDEFTRVYSDVLRRFDRLYETPLPYLAGLHQYRDAAGQRDGYLHAELASIRRGADKLKYLASSESLMDAFITDTIPEAVAARLRALGERPEGARP